MEWGRSREGKIENLKLKGRKKREEGSKKKE
jgi:hypothetical protein